MSALVLPFTGMTALASPIACYIRIGAAHQKLADLHAASRFPATRIVVDASRIGRQGELMNVMRDAGSPIVLDTEAAELAAPAKFSGQACHAPRGLPSIEGPLGPEHFKRRAPRDVIGHIARFAVQSKVDVVLSPAHFLGGPAYADWLATDRHACVLLREALDREGGTTIAIDYPIIIAHSDLNDPDIRGKLTVAFADLPIDNIWIRASGLGSNSGPQTVRRYLTAVAHFHRLGKPIVADHLGGLVGAAALAFGVVSGIAHGINERERFDASFWHKLRSPRAEDMPFGRTTRIGIPDLNRSATREELDLLAKARGGRRLIGCGDRGCCLNGYDDMLADPRRHAVQQTFKAVAELQAVPDLKREHYFLNGPMSEADRRARQIKNLRPPADEAARRGIDLDKLMGRFSEQSRKLEQLHAALLDQHEECDDSKPRAPPVRVQDTNLNAKEHRL
jgi:hypothetical protein